MRVPEIMVNFALTPLYTRLVDAHMELLRAVKACTNYQLCLILGLKERREMPLLGRCQMSGQQGKERYCAILGGCCYF